MLSTWDLKRLEEPLNAEIQSFSRTGLVSVWFSNFMELPALESDSERMLQNEDSSVAIDKTPSKQDVFIRLTVDDEEDLEDVQDIDVKVTSWVVDEYDSRVLRL